MITSIQTVIFERSLKVRKSKRYNLGFAPSGIKEEGILLNEGDLGIIDGKGLVVKEVWTYSTISDLSIFNLMIGTDKEKKKAMDDYIKWKKEAEQNQIARKRVTKRVKKIIHFRRSG